MRDPIDTHQDTASESQQEADARRKALQAVEDLKWLMAHAQGRRIVARIFEQTGIRRTPFHTNGSTMAFNTGQQNIGLWLEAEVLSAAPDGYYRLLKEYRNE